MNKPKPFIHWEDDDYYEMGYVNFGRVGIPVFVMIMVYLVIAAVFAVGGIFFNPLWWALAGMGITLASIVVILLGSFFVWWVWDSIYIAGTSDEKESE